MSDLFDFVEKQAQAHGLAPKQVSPQAQQQDAQPEVQQPKAPRAPKQELTRTYEAEPNQSAEVVFSVSDISNALRQTVEHTFADIAVEGEVGSLRLPGSGHVYFNLKDEQNVLKAVVWRSAAARLKIRLEEGLKVVAKGRLTTYGPRSEYQMVVERMEIAGVGDLMRLLEERRQKLAAEGLFDEARKKPIPFLPQKIGVVTSPTGAVIQDILHRVQARFPLPVVVWPVRVQGVGAAEEITAAIQGFNALPLGHPQRPDVLIVARGGGSLEDLWAFNEENVVRAVAASEIPVLSGVGHEPDVTLVDYAADRRAPTPTAAAEMAVPVRSECVLAVQGIQRRLGHLMRQRLATARELLKFYQRMIPSPKTLITQAQLKTEERRERLERAMTSLLRQRTQKLAHVAQLLASVSPQAPLKRGYVYVTTPAGEVVKTAATKAAHVVLTFADGTRTATLAKPE